MSTPDAGDVNPQEQRLSAALTHAGRRLKRLESDPGRNAAAIEACRDALNRATLKAQRGTQYEAWDCLHQFEAAHLEGLTDEERQARWCTLQKEADAKLTGWRHDAAECLKALAASHKQREEKRRDKAKKEGREVDTEAPIFVPFQIVSELHGHVATNYQNAQFKLAVLNDLLPVLKWILVGVIVVAFGFAAVVFNVDRYSMFEKWAKAIMLGVPAGALGGIVSMAFSIGRADLKARIPELRFSSHVTMIRPLLGATVAIPILVLVQADVVNVLKIDDWLEIFIFCFLGGRSERWFLGLMESLETLQKS